MLLKSTCDESISEYALGSMYRMVANSESGDTNLRDLLGGEGCEVDKGADSPDSPRIDQAED